MFTRLKATFALTILLTVAVLVLGAVVPHASGVSSKSPYVSALSNFATGTAVAAGKRCPNRGCLVLQGIGSCRTGEYVGTDCAIVSGHCTETSCR